MCFGRITKVFRFIISWVLAPSFLSYRRRQGRTRNSRKKENTRSETVAKVDSKQKHKQLQLVATKLGFSAITSLVPPQHRFSARQGRSQSSMSANDRSSRGIERDHPSFGGWETEVSLQHLVLPGSRPPVSKWVLQRRTREPISTIAHHSARQT